MNTKTAMIYRLSIDSTVLQIDQQHFKSGFSYHSKYLLRMVMIIQIIKMRRYHQMALKTWHNRNLIYYWTTMLIWRHLISKSLINIKTSVKTELKHPLIPSCLHSLSSNVWPSADVTWPSHFQQPKNDNENHATVSKNTKQETTVPGRKFIELFIGLD